MIKERILQFLGKERLGELPVEGEFVTYLYRGGFVSIHVLTENEEEPIVRVRVRRHVADKFFGENKPVFGMKLRVTQWTRADPGKIELVDEISSK